MTLPMVTQTTDFLFTREHPAINGESLSKTFADSADFFDQQLGRARDDEAEIRRDRGLTEQGKADAIAERRAHHMAHTEELTGIRLRMLVKDRDRLEGELIGSQVRRAPPPGMDAAEAAGLAVDVRSVFRAMSSPSDRREKYMQASRDGDVLTLGALEAIPASVAMIDEATITEAREVFARAASPEKYAALEEHRLAISSIEGDLNRVKRELAPSLTAALVP